MVLSQVPWQMLLTPFGIPIVAILAVFAWLAIVSVAEAVAKVSCHRNDCDLKLELLARGFSAEEIARVIEAKGGAASTDKPQPTHTHSARHTAAVG